MNYESMSDFEINKAVANKLGLFVVAVAQDGIIVNGKSLSIDYCNNPSDAWPIIIENNIGVYAKSDSDYEIGMCNFTGCWCANGINSVDGEFGMAVDVFEFVDENPLRAAMIVFLMMQND